MEESSDHNPERRRSSIAKNMKDFVKRKSFARAFSSVKIQTHTNLHTGLPVDYDTLHSSADELLSLIGEFEKKVQADRILADDYDKELFDQLKRNIVISHEFAPTRDFGPIECNGVRMLLNHAKSYFSVAVKKKRTKELRAFLEVIKVMDTWFKMIVCMKDMNLSSTGR